MTSSLRSAIELSDNGRTRALLVVNPEACSEFLKRLDQPAQPNERLQQTMQLKVPWQRA